MADTSTDLQPDELASLRRLRHEPARRRIPESHGERLLRGGYAKIQGTALVITARGHAKLVYELTRASWFAKPV